VCAVGAVLLCLCLLVCSGWHEPQYQVGGSGYRSALQQLRRHQAASTPPYTGCPACCFVQLPTHWYCIFPSVYFSLDHMSFVSWQRRLTATWYGFLAELLLASAPCMSLAAARPSFVRALVQRHSCRVCVLSLRQQCRASSLASGCAKSGTLYVLTSSRAYKALQVRCCTYK